MMIFVLLYIYTHFRNTFSVIIKKRRYIVVFLVGIWHGYCNLAYQEIT